jgi:hypothetical protein
MTPQTIVNAVFQLIAFLFAISIHESVGIFGLLALVYLGGNLLGRLISPFLGFFDSILVKL